MPADLDPNCFHTGLCKLIEFLKKRGGGGGEGGGMFYIIVSRIIRVKMADKAS